jgi:multicomponent Na+:H+ antiporter subunit F
MISIPSLSFLPAVVTVMTVAFFLSFLRIIKGPTAGDRFIALDAATTITTALLVVLGVVYDRVWLIDVAIIYALLSFIAVIAIARYLEGGL